MVRPLLIAVASIALAGCGTGESEVRDEQAAPATSSSATATPGPVPSRGTKSARPGPRPSDGRAAPATLSVPALGLRDLDVVPYRGRTDDARGTAIQDGGDLASPHGPGGGTGPGGIGNYQVTGHRLSSTAPFRFLPRLTRGDVVRVESGGSRYVYRIVATRETSFRSARSLREQRAAVPGRPGVEPARAMLTLSTCATLEDHAEGNYWSDRFDNPEHRIDKVGVLVRVRRA